MSKPKISSDILQSTTFLPSTFNKKKFSLSYQVPSTPRTLEIQNSGRSQVFGRNPWHPIERINGWMLSAETATFMKAGGLGMIASELPDIFNLHHSSQGETLRVVTPMYIGNTGKKKAEFDGHIYHGAEHCDITLKRRALLTVPFISDADCQTFTDYPVEVYTGFHENTPYIFLKNEHFFSINPSKKNPPAQDGCYILNEHNVNEVERFAFFSKAVYTLLLHFLGTSDYPNVIIANDWHSGTISGLTKYLPLAMSEKGQMDEETSDALRSLPVVHIAHHLGYQGWDYDNTARILNSLYGEHTAYIFKNAKAVKNSNRRAFNTLIVHDCYNQASCNFHLADRVVTVSKNYMEEVSKELGFGYDFRDILKIRKDHCTFLGIVNGYNKQLISPNADKIRCINEYFGETEFKTYNETDLNDKLHNKIEFIKLVSHIAKDKSYKDKIIPLIDTYRFADISDCLPKAASIPVVCATSRLVEQKGYDIAAQSILNFVQKYSADDLEMPIFVLGGAGNIELFRDLQRLKDTVTKINPQAGARIFVFHGYRDQFAYAVQLAADFYLMPCRFEPCGLTQMEALAKGSLPIAMSTGGLVDTIDDHIDGFRTEVFFSEGRHVYGNNITARRLKNNINAYNETLENALLTFYEMPNLISEMQRHAMQKDFSWDVADGSLEKYYSLLKTGHL
ncbi:MAG: glycogen/starch synthase [Alphaproteobacteria bacterium]|nr:glycogen/starch synthase [Alphaproteobacteria bacterium]